jgi:ketosteroid isomerase-like protein
MRISFRKAYNAFGSGDMETVGRLFADDIEFHVAGVRSGTMRPTCTLMTSSLRNHVLEFSNPNEAEATLPSNSRRQTVR